MLREKILILSNLFGMYGLIIVLSLLVYLIIYLKNKRKKEKPEQKKEMDEDIEKKILKKEMPKFEYIKKLHYNHNERYEGMKNFTEYNKSWKNKLITIEDRISEERIANAYDKVYHDFLINMRKFILDVFKKEVNNDINNFIVESKKNDYRRMSESGFKELFTQFKDIKNGQDLSAELNTIISGVENIHEVMIAIANTIYDSHADVRIKSSCIKIKENAETIKTSITPQNIDQYLKEGTRKRSYNLLLILGEVFERRMLEYFRYMDDIFVKLDFN